VREVYTWLTRSSQSLSLSWILGDFLTSWSLSLVSLELFYTCLGAPRERDSRHTILFLSQNSSLCRIFARGGGAVKWTAVNEKMRGGGGGTVWNETRSAINNDFSERLSHLELMSVSWLKRVKIGWQWTMIAPTNWLFFYIGFQRDSEMWSIMVNSYSCIKIQCDKDE
jgi:hypothetical protein